MSIEETRFLDHDKAVLSVRLEEYRILRQEIDASIHESDRWLQFSLTIAGAFIAGGLTAAEVVPEATPALMLVASIYVGFSALLYLRGDMKRARVLAYFSQQLFPDIRIMLDDDSLLSWHQYSKTSSNALRKKSKFSISFMKHGYLGRMVVFVFLFAAAGAFLAAAVLQLRTESYRPDEPFLQALYVVGVGGAFVWLVSLISFAWPVRKHPNFHGG